MNRKSTILEKEVISRKVKDKDENFLADEKGDNFSQNDFFPMTIKKMFLLQTRVNGGFQVHGCGRNVSEDK